MQNFTIKEQKQASFWSFSMVSITLSQYQRKKNNETEDIIL
jgi:hypothetical protein